MTDCTCKPGNYEEGWQEKRCPACVRAETDAFREAIERWRSRDLLRDQ